MGPTIDNLELPTNLERVGIGSFVVPRLIDTPRELVELFTGAGARCDQFREKIRYVNELLAMTSLETSVPGAGDRTELEGRCFAITG